MCSFQVNCKAKNFLQSYSVNPLGTKAKKSVFNMTAVTTSNLGIVSYENV